MGSAVCDVVDDLGRALELERPAQRVVSLVPSLTELLFALSRGPAVIGVTRYCVEPAAQVAHVEKVGGTKNPDVEAVIRLNPDLVVVNAEENRRADVDALLAAGLTVFIAFTHRVAEVPSLMRRLGVVTGSADVAEELALQLENAIRMNTDRSTRRRFFCPIWKNPWMTFNADTFTDDVLNLAGGLNVCADATERYPTVELASIAAAGPEVILLPDEPYVFAPKDLPSLRPLHDTPAWRSQRVHFVDGKALSWYGPRTAAALAYFKSLLD